MFWCSQQIGVVYSCERYYVLPLFIGNHRLLRSIVYLEVYESRCASGTELQITTFRKSLLYFLFLALLFFPEDRKSFLCPASSVSIGHSHSISRHKPRIPSQKFNMCLHAQAVVAKIGIDCDHWCPYIKRHQAPLCLVVTHVWKPAFNS